MNTVVGLFGMMCSGKDTVAEILEKHGFIKISLSEDVLRPILLKLRLKPDRLNYIKLGKALKEFKPDALAFLCHGLMNKGNGLKYVIPNIMTYQEAKFFKERKDIKFFLFKVSAEQKIRFERNLARRSEKDVNDLATFKRMDIKNLTQTGLKELMHAHLEDYEIVNNGSLKELNEKVEWIIRKFEL